MKPSLLLLFAVAHLAYAQSTPARKNTYHASGSTVPELAFNMTQQGLSVAPCNPGDEPAYHAVHNAVVSYITAAQASSGFQLRLRTPKPQPGAKY